MFDLKSLYARCLFMLLMLAVWITPSWAAQAVRDMPMAVRMVLARAQIQMEKKDYTQALELLEAFLANSQTKSKNSHYMLHYMIGNCHLLQTNQDAAIQAYARALEDNSSYSPAWFNRAKANYELEQYAEAARCFDRAYATAQPQRADLLYYQGTAYLMAQAYDQAVAVFERLIKSHPDQVQLGWKENLVHAYLSTDQSLKALPHIQTLAYHYQGAKQLQWQEILLYQYLNLGLDQKAQTYAQKLTRHAPLNAKWWKALAHINLATNRNKDALAALTIYSYLQPLNKSEQKMLADLNLQTGIPSQAVPHYSALLEDQCAKEPLRYLITALRQMGQLQVALESMQRFCPDSSDPDLLMLKGELLYTLERFQEALKTFKKAATTLDSVESDRTGHAWLMAAYAAWQVEDLAAAQKAFQHAAQYPKQQKRARQALKRLNNATIFHSIEK